MKNISKVLIFSLSLLAATGVKTSAPLNYDFDFDFLFRGQAKRLDLPRACFDKEMVRRGYQKWLSEFLGKDTFELMRKKGLYLRFFQHRTGPYKKGPEYLIDMQVVLVNRFTGKPVYGYHFSKYSKDFADREMRKQVIQHIFKKCVKKADRKHVMAKDEAAKVFANLSSGDAQLLYASFPGLKPTSKLKRAAQIAGGLLGVAGAGALGIYLAG